MNITRSNWNQLLPFIKETLKKADLVSIDFEMTGVQASPLLRNSILDSMQLRYWKSRENVTRFLPLQIGICGFQIKDDLTIEAYPFNIYLYPFTGHDQMDKVFIFSGGAMQFLATHNYDFNRTFYDGVPYLSKESEELLIKSEKMTALKDGLKLMNSSIDPEMLSYVQANLKMVKSFLSSDQQQLTIDIKFVKVRNYKYLVEKMKILTKGQHFNITYDSDVLFKRTSMTITKSQTEVDTQEITDEIDPVGVRHLIDQLVEQKTPLLLHNGFTDLCQLYDKFVYSLPESQVDFKKEVQKVFPVIYDTKYMVNSSNLLFNQIKKFSQLKNCYVSLEEFKESAPQIKINEDFTDYKLHPILSETEIADSFEHEAGYDALMTGYIFFKSAALIINGKSPMQNKFIVDHERLKYFKNRLPLGSVRYPFNLEDGEDKYHETTTQIFHMCQVEKELIPHTSVKDYFATNNLGGINIFITYGQIFEYFMTFEQQNLSENFLKLLKDGSTIIKVDDKHIIVTTYDSYKQQLQKRVLDELEIRGEPSSPK